MRLQVAPEIVAVAVCVGVEPHVQVVSLQSATVTVVASVLTVPVNGPPVLKPVWPLVGLVIVSTGGVRSTVNTGPVTAAAVFPAPSCTEFALRLSPRLPSPVPVPAMTV